MGTGFGNVRLGTNRKSSVHIASVSFWNKAAVSLRVISSPSDAEAAVPEIVL
jgi:hypothetical protein